MKHLKNFQAWITENFSQVGVAPAGNVTGMGDVSAPTQGAVGSGDAWPSIGVYSQVKIRKKRRKRRS